MFDSTYNTNNVSKLLYNLKDLNQQKINLTDILNPQNDTTTGNMSNILTIIYILIFIIGFFSNFLVIYFVLVYKRMQTMTNKFITNLAVADLLCIFICIPVTIGRSHKPFEWIFGEFLCRTTTFIQGVSLSVSVLTLTAISLDRYYIIYKPLKARTICTNKKVRLTVTFIWCVSILIMSPLLMVFQLHQVNVENLPKFDLCIENWPQFEIKLAYETLLFLVLFLFPIIFITYAYVTISQTLWNVEEKLIFTKEDYNTANKSIINETSMTNIHLHHKQIQLEKHQHQNNDPDQLQHSSATTSSCADLATLQLYNKLSKKKHASSRKFYKYIKCENFLICLNKSKTKNYSLTGTDDCVDGVDIKMLQVALKLNGIKVSARNSIANKSQIFLNIHAGGAASCCGTPMTAPTHSLQRNYNRSSSNTNGALFNTTTNGGHVPIHTAPARNNSTSNNNRINENAISKLIRSRRRVVKLLIVLVFLFVLSWLPYHLVSLTIDFLHFSEIHASKFHSHANNTDFTYSSSTSSSTTTTYNSVRSSSSSPSTSTLTNSSANSSGSGGQNNGNTTYLILSEYVHPITLCLALANSATNPVCYCLLSHGFRAMFKMNFLRLKNRLCCSKNLGDQQIN